MNEIQQHRGPNSSGKFINSDKDFGLKMCRLSILDLELGIQPMHSIDDRYVVIFNGTILNSPELRKDLENQNIKFLTKNSDTNSTTSLTIVPLWGLTIGLGHGPSRWNPALFR